MHLLQKIHSAACNSAILSSDAFSGADGAAHGITEVTQWCREEAKDSLAYKKPVLTVLTQKKAADDHRIVCATKLPADARPHFRPPCG